VKFDLGGGGVQYAVLHMDVIAYKPEECPLCRQRIPVTKPGSRGNM
jgi:orotate phosphoribosyltransferase